MCDKNTSHILTGRLFGIENIGKSQWEWSYGFQMSCHF